MCHVVIPGPVEEIKNRPRFLGLQRLFFSSGPGRCWLISQRMSARKAILIHVADSPEPSLLNPEGQSHEKPTDVGEPCDVTLMIDTEVTAGALDGKPYEYEDH
jgi:hypothetical protein